MKTYIINLERSVRRREHILTEVRKYGLEHEIVPAVDGTIFTEADIEKVADMERVRADPEWLTPTMIATALSHRRAYERMIEEGDKVALVLEDDARFASDPRRLLDSIEPVVGESEVVLLHYFSFKPLGISTVGSNQLNETTIVAYPIALQGLVSAAAYIITLAAGRSLYDSVCPITTSSDAWVDFVEKGWLDTTRVVYPRPVDVIGAKSTISVASQSGVRALLTEYIDKHQIPILHGLLRRQRLRNINSMSDFFLTDQPSPHSGPMDSDAF